MILFLFLGDEIVGVWKDLLECQIFVVNLVLKDVGELKKYFVYLMIQLMNDEVLVVVVWGDGLKEGLILFN